MIVGGYTLELYCDARPDDTLHTRALIVAGDGFGEFVGEKASTCRRLARKAGWLLNLKEGTCICPACRKKASE